MMRGKDELLSYDEVTKRFENDFHWVFVLSDEESCPRELIDPEIGYISNKYTDNITSLSIKSGLYDQRFNLLPAILISRDGNNIKFINNAERYLEIYRMERYIIIYRNDNNNISDTLIDLETGTILHEYDTSPVDVERIFENFYSYN